MRCGVCSVTVILMCFLLFVCEVSAQSASISINSPDNEAIVQQVNGVANIIVSVTAVSVPSGGGVQFVLDAGTSIQKSSNDYSSPYSYTFASVPLGEHTLDVYIIDGTGVRLSAHDSRTHIGVGDIVIAMGDSITAGEVDDITTDNWSSDGRNGPYVDSYTGTEYGGFEPILNDLLTEAKGYPHSVINMGYPGDMASDGLAKVSSIIAQYPTARTWLISYGANDASKKVTATVYKQNLQQIIDKIQAAIPDAVIYLPHAFYYAFTVIPTYHDRIGDLIRNNDNVCWGADLYTVFNANHSLYDHLTGESGTWFAETASHHPNGIGCQVMAKLWKMAIVDHAFLVTNGVLPSVGALWADKIQLNGVDQIGLNDDNLLLVSEQWKLSSSIPAGTSSVPDGWSVLLSLTNGVSFAGGSIKTTIRVENDNLPQMGASSWNQVWLSKNSTLLSTSRVLDATNKNNYDLTANITAQGQVVPVADVTPPVTKISVSPSVPDGSNGSYNSVPVITLTATDSTKLSVASIHYRWDASGSDQVYSTAINGVSGTHTLYYWAIDRSGNVETVKSKAFTVGSNPTTIAIKSPTSLAIFQQSAGVANIPVAVTTSSVPSGGGVEYILDSGTSAQVITKVYGTSFAYTFKNVPVGDHTIDAYVINSAGTLLSAHDVSAHVGVGDIVVAMGDDITAGEDDNVHLDDSSNDGRNGPYTNPKTGDTYGGFEPILNDLLTSVRGYPQSIINEGADGDTSATGLSRVSQVIARNPTAKTWLIGYGLYDLKAGVSWKTFKTNITGIVSKIRTAIPDATIYLPKVFYSGYSQAQSYNDALGDVIRNTDNLHWGADLETMFHGNHNQTGSWFSSNTINHPNGVGIQMIAKLWEMALVHNAYLVTDGVLSSVGGIWADKVQLTGVDKIGLSANNLLLVSEVTCTLQTAPAGTSIMGGGWGLSLSLSGASTFAGNKISGTIRVENDNLTGIGATSFKQAWLAEDSVILSTTRKVDAKSVNNYDLTASISKPGQIVSVGDTTPPVSICVPSPATPDGTNGVYNTIPTITLSGKDSTGLVVASTHYRWDSGSDVIYSTSIRAATGTHTLYYYSIDQSGNIESVKSKTFVVSATAK